MGRFDEDVPDDSRPEPLSALRWHWGTAYLICHPEPYVWLAQRRDTHETLRAWSPAGLLDCIRTDYAVRPVPRGS